MAEEARALNIDVDAARDMSLIDLAYSILMQTNKPYYFRDLMQEVAQLRVMTESDVMDVIARLYTEINIDGRFLCVGSNVWGLKRWYPVDKTADKAVGGKRILRKNEDDDFYGDEDEEVFEELEDDDDPFVAGFVADDEEVTGDLEVDEDIEEEEDEADSADDTESETVEEEDDDL